jgi:TatD DNase family protein
VVDVGCDVPSSVGAVQEAQAHDAVIAAVAIHPHDAAQLGDGLDEALRGVEALFGSTDRIRGVGETGLDYYWVTDEPGRAVSATPSRPHRPGRGSMTSRWSSTTGTPTTICSTCLDAEGWPTRVQMHCFSGDADLARRCLDRGAWLSFPGTVTFKANEALREAARITPPIGCSPRPTPPT